MAARDKLNLIDGLDNAFSDILIGSSGCCRRFAPCHKTVLPLYETKQ